MGLGAGAGDSLSGVCRSLSAAPGPLGNAGWLRIARPLALALVRPCRCSSPLLECLLVVATPAILYLGSSKVSGRNDIARRAIFCIHPLAREGSSCRSRHQPGYANMISKGALPDLPVLQLPCSVSVRRFTALSCAGCESVPALAPACSCTGTNVFQHPT